MKQREQYKRFMTIFLSTLILAMHIAAYAYIWYAYYRYEIPLPFWRKGNWVVIGLYGLILFFFINIYGGFKIGFLRITDIIYSQILSILCVNFITYWQNCLIARWFIIVVPFVKLTIIEVISVILWSLAANALYSRFFPPHNILIIHADRNPDELVAKLLTRKDKYSIGELIHINEGMPKVYEKMQQYDSILLADIPVEYRNPLLKYCFANSKRCYLHQKISDVIIRGADNLHLFDTPLLLARNIGLNFEQRFLKRTMDILISLPLLILFSPIMILISIGIKLYDFGPVFYRQERLTIHGTPFSIYKFRSMIVDSEKNGARLASKYDKRITPFGHFLRNTHFDELPQLINVLRGDMSLVGPRPERMEIMKEYEKKIPEFSYRLKVKAGLTGYAQVYGQYSTTAFDKLKLDLYYIENYSVWLDLKLLLMTFKIMFQREKSEGIEDKNL